MITTLNQIRRCNPCSYEWNKLFSALNKTKADNEPLPISTIVKTNGFEFALWCLRAVNGYDREIRLFGVWCAKQVRNSMTDQRSLAAVDVSERYAIGQATNGELTIAMQAAWDAALDSKHKTQWDPAWAAAKNTAWAVAEAAAEAAAWTTLWAVEWTTLESAARDAAWANAGVVRATTKDAQKAELVRICREVEASGFNYQN